MSKERYEDTLTIKDESGYEKVFDVQARFTMHGETYAIITGDTETLLMRIEENGDEQYLIGINDIEEREAILEAYETTLDTNNNIDSDRFLRNGF